MIKQTIGYILEVSGFVAGGFLIGKGNEVGLPIIIFSFLISFWVGRQIVKDTVNKMKELK